MTTARERTRFESDGQRAKILGAGARATLPFGKGSAWEQNRLLFLSAMVAIGASVALAILPPDTVDAISQRLTALISGLTGLGAFLLSGVRKAATTATEIEKKSGEAADQFRNILVEWDKIVEEDEPDADVSSSELASRQQELESDIQLQLIEISQADAQIRGAEAELEEAGRQLESARQSARHPSERNLREFVNARLAEGDYRRRLGHLQQVEEDLAELAAMVESEQTRGRAPSRIVLFIDDLDRCPPDQVVDVLEAIQLLLAENRYMTQQGNTSENRNVDTDGDDDQSIKQTAAATKFVSPFAVVLGADTRLLTRALESRYARILDPENPPSGLDYLEKIIQIPYRTNAIDPDSFVTYVSKLMDVEGPVGVVRSSPGARVDQTSAVQSSRSVTGLGPLQWRLDTNVQLVFGSDLQNFTMYKKLAATYPRAIKRLVNQYRLCKVMSLRSGVFTERETAFLLTMASGFRHATRYLVRRLNDPNLARDVGTRSLLKEGRSDSAAARAVKSEIEAVLPELQRLEQEDQPPTPAQLSSVLNMVVPFRSSEIWISRGLIHLLAMVWRVNRIHCTKHSRAFRAPRTFVT